jgi:hypothetical protein
MKQAEPCLDDVKKKEVVKVSSASKWDHEQLVEEIQARGGRRRKEDEVKYENEWTLGIFEECASCTNFLVLG